MATLSQAARRGNGATSYFSGHGHRRPSRFILAQTVEPFFAVTIATVKGKVVVAVADFDSASAMACEFNTDVDRRPGTSAFVCRAKVIVAS